MAAHDIQDATDRAQTLLREWIAAVGQLNTIERDDLEPAPPHDETKPAGERLPPRSYRAAAPAEPAREEDRQQAARLKAELDALKETLAAERETLAAERRRFAELRTEMDGLLVVKALWEREKARAEELRADRDRWTARARALALPLFQDGPHLVAKAEDEEVQAAASERHSQG